MGGNFQNSRRDAYVVFNTPDGEDYYYKGAYKLQNTEYRKYVPIIQQVWA